MKKFIRSLIIIIILTIVVAIVIKQNQTLLYRANYKKYTVQEGDCLWTIAEKTKPEGVSVRNYLAELQYVNNVNVTIYPGQQLKIPVKEKE